MNEFEPESYDRPDELENMVRENPTRAIVFALGVGMIIALIVRALQPPPPKARALRLIEDLRDQLSDLADPAYRRARGLASNGASLVEEGVDRLSDLHIDRKLNKMAGRLRKLFR
jgi:ElaB/YqjD/DUF883 family membrane-anchored ribosome-binding protein